MSFPLALSTLLNMVYLGIVLFYVLFVPIYVFVKWHKLNKKNEHENFYCLFAEYKKNRISALFNFFFFLRRFLFAIILLFFRKIMMVGCALNLLINIGWLFYLIIVWPYNLILLNIVMIVNEILIMILSILFFLFVIGIDLNFLSDVVGWIMFSLTISLIVFNLLVILILKIIEIKEKISNLYEKYKKKKHPI